MNKRYKITKQNDSGESILTLEQCKEFFASQPDFSYNDHYIVASNESKMTIPGEFFMWSIENVQIPFRFFDGEVYVAISHPIIFEKMVEIAEKLNASYIEG